MPNAVDNLRQSFPTARIDQYFEPWAVESMRFRQMVAHANTLDIVAHVAANMQPSQANADEKPYDVQRGNTAILSVSGPITKGGGSLAPASTTRMRKAIRSAMNDEAIEAIVLKIDSPGGTVSGIADLGDDIRMVAQRKPVTAYIEDIGASAAYWLASQATQVYSNRSALIGSIGVYNVVYDASERAAKLGVKVHVVKAGEFKGSGTEGTAITDEQLAEYQRIVNAFNAQFITAVATGRGVSEAKVRKWADGRVYTADEAVEMGFIDAIKTWDQVINEAAALGGTTRRSIAMSDDTTIQAEADETSQAAAEQVTPEPQATETVATPQAATMDQLEAIFAGDPTAILQAFKANATVDQAQTACIGQLRDRVNTLEATVAERDTTIAEQQSKLDTIANAGEPDPVAETAAAPHAYATPEQQAEAEWEANYDGCRGKVQKREWYVASRVAQLKRDA